MTNIDVTRLYEAFCALPSSEQKSGTYIAKSNFKILHNNVSDNDPEKKVPSLVLGDKEQVVKIIPANEYLPTNQAIALIEKEFKNLTLCQSLRGSAFKTPAPIASGIGPAHVIMTRFKKPCGYVSMEWDYQRVGRAMGEFAAALWMQEGLIYRDIHPYNFTIEPNGDVGILDAAAIGEPQTHLWNNPKERKSLEEMFLSPMMVKPCLVPIMATEFVKQTGISVDFAWFETLQNIVVRNLMSNNDRELVEIIASNLLELRNYNTCHRPDGKSHPSCTSPTSRL